VTNDGSCVRLRPEHANHVWSYDFVSAKTHDGRTVKMLNLIDEHTRESLLVRPERRWSSAKVIEALADVMVAKGVPEHIRSDNGPEFVAKDLRKWLADTGARALYIEPGSPRENGYCESFNAKLRDGFLNGEIFYSLKEVQVLAERWRVHYNTIRPHSSLGYRSPAPEAWALQTNLTGCGEWGIATLSHSPQPIRQLFRYFKSCATPTIQLDKTSGTAVVDRPGRPGEVPSSHRGSFIHLAILVQRVGVGSDSPENAVMCLVPHLGLHTAIFRSSVAGNILDGRPWVTERGRGQ
jgi:putative transposase